MTPQYFGNLGVTTPQYFGYWGVATTRYPRGRRVVIFYLDLDIGPPWVNFKAINLKFSKIVGHIVFSNQWKFQIDSSQIKISMKCLSYKQ